MSQRTSYSPSGAFEIADQIVNRWPSPLHTEGQALGRMLSARIISAVFCGLVSPNQTRSTSLRSNLLIVDAFGHQNGFRRP